MYSLAQKSTSIYGLAIHSSSNEFTVLACPAQEHALNLPISDNCFSASNSGNRITLSSRVYLLLVNISLDKIYYLVLG